MKKFMMSLVLVCIFALNFSASCLAQWEADSDASAEPSVFELPQNASAYAPGTGNSQGNLVNGGFVASDGSRVFYVADGLWQMNVDGMQHELLAQGNYCALNVYGGYLYCLKETKEPAEIHDYTWNAWHAGMAEHDSQTTYIEDVTAYTPYRIRISDGTIEPLGEKRSDADGLCAYAGFCIADEHIYFLSRNNRAGTYDIRADGQVYAMNYTSGNSVYRMDLDGSNIDEILPDVGNGYGGLSICNDRIYVQTVYITPFSEGRIVDYVSCDLNGGNIQTHIAGTNRHYCWDDQISSRGILSNEYAFMADGGYLYVEQPNGGTGAEDYLLSRYSADGGSMCDEMAVTLGAFPVISGSYIYYWASGEPGDHNPHGNQTTPSIYRASLIDLQNPQALIFGDWFCDSRWIGACSIGVIGSYLYISFDYSYLQSDIPGQEGLLRIDLATLKAQRLWAGTLSDY